MDEQTHKIRVSVSIGTVHGHKERIIDTGMTRDEWNLLPNLQKAKIAEDALWELITWDWEDVD